MRKLKLLALFVALAIPLAACTDDLTSPVVGDDLLATSYGGGYGGDISGPCEYSVHGNTSILKRSCTADATFFIPDGGTLKCYNRTIHVVDPEGGNFLGAVIRNAGATAYVRNCRINAPNLNNVCQSGDNRLRAILFDGASGAITGNRVPALNKGASGCQEGNAIEVRNAPFDGTHPNTQTVNIARNKLFNWQKTGIVANGDVNVRMRFNTVHESATQDNLAANTLQCGFGAICDMSRNRGLEGNQWKGTSDFAASGILCYLAECGIDRNRIRGNSDVGIFVIADGIAITKNRVIDVGADHVNSGYDIGIGAYGTGNTESGNTIKGFDTPTDGFVAPDQTSDLIAFAQDVLSGSQPSPFNP